MEDARGLEDRRRALRVHANHLGISEPENNNEWRGKQWGMIKNHAEDGDNGDERPKSP